MKAYSKTLFRMLRQHLGRFLAVTAIIALGIGFMTGLGSVKPKLIGTLDKYYSDRAVPDLILKSTAGFSQAQIDALKDLSDDFSFIARYGYGRSSGRQNGAHTVYAAVGAKSEQA